MVSKANDEVQLETLLKPQNQHHWSVKNILVSLALHIYSTLYTMKNISATYWRCPSSDPYFLQPSIRACHLPCKSAAATNTGSAACGIYLNAVKRQNKNTSYDMFKRWTIATADSQISSKRPLLDSWCWVIHSPRIYASRWIPNWKGIQISAHHTRQS
jgi:hypothetical protein